MTRPMQLDLTAPRDMVLTRRFDAPRDLVWKCWTDPEHLAVWWGPDGMSNRIEQDLRPGGYQRIVMMGPDGTEYPVAITVTDVVEGEKLAGVIGTEGHPASDIPDNIVMTVTFADAAGGGTEVTVRQTFASETERDANMALGAETGWRESFVKLDTLLTRLGGAA